MATTSKQTFVTLNCPALGDRQFEVSHAERLLAMPNNGGWHLPENSPYMYENGSISRRHKKENTGAKE
jgi:hypothetical protein